jgi:hypothetical protein
MSGKDLIWCARCGQGFHALVWSYNTEQFTHDLSAFKLRPLLERHWNYGLGTEGPCKGGAA